MVTSIHHVNHNPIQSVRYIQVADISNLELVLDVGGSASISLLQTLIKSVYDSNVGKYIV